MASTAMNYSTLLGNEPGVASRGVVAEVSRMLGNALAGQSFVSMLFTLLAAAIIYDQLRYFYNKHGNCVGPAFKIPFMGPFLESINPKWEKYVAKWNSGPVSCVSVFHKFVVLTSTRDISRKVLNSPQFVSPCVVDIAKQLLRPTNWVFLDGKRHVEFRKGLNGLFGRKALDGYLPEQEIIYNKFFKRWIQKSKETPAVPFMPEFREINCALSCRAFVGHYLPDDKVKRIADDYYWVTAALDLVNFPIIIPFTRTWYGKKCADMILEEFEKCAAMSKEQMEKGGEVTCTLDAWVKNMIDSREYAAAGGKDQTEVPPPAVNIRMFSNAEIAQTIFTFLFASQDASSSATTWLFQLVADRPDVRARILEEQLRVRGGDPYKKLDMDLVDQMVYTKAVVKETLRYRPPVTMVPYVVNKDFPIVEGYTIPKGSMVVPALYPALNDPEVYVNPDSFNPDRWLPGGEGEKAVKNWLVFGTGPHYCLGQNYAVTNFISMIGKAVMFLDWEHHVTDLSEEIKVFATIFPKDDCILTFKERMPLPA